MRVALRAKIQRCAVKKEAKQSMTSSESKNEVMTSSNARASTDSIEDLFSTDNSDFSPSPLSNWSLTTSLSPHTDLILPPKDTDPSSSSSQLFQALGDILN